MLALRYTADFIGKWMPLAIMSAGTLGSFILLKQAPTTLQNNENPSITDGYDYFVKDFGLYLFSQQGDAKLSLAGSKAQHFPKNAELKMNRVSFYAQNEKLTLHGVANDTTIPDGAQAFALKGDVQLVQNHRAMGVASLHVSSEYFLFKQNPLSASTSFPVIIQKNGNTFSAGSLDLQSDSKILNLNGRVRAEISTRR
jgi:LPS export ABC transporter protein LptC